MSPLADKRITVTGGAGFLGRNVVSRLREKGCKEIFVPRSRDYDLVENEAVKRLYRDSRPDVVIHLAAVVGGIGANRQNPGAFFYKNLMMGVQMIEQGRQFGLEKFVAVGTICAYHARMAERSGYRSIYLSGGGVALRHRIGDVLRSLADSGKINPVGGR